MEDNPTQSRYITVRFVTNERQAALRESAHHSMSQVDDLLTERVLVLLDSTIFLLYVVVIGSQNHNCGGLILAQYLIQLLRLDNDKNKINALIVNRKKWCRKNNKNIFLGIIDNS
ncbi:unnamed protein product [Spodoptera exigua]|nr:unnamed protein product [Spodoptera exigua]